MRIENEFLSVDVTLDGGSLTSVYDKKNNVELLYQKDERSWMGQDVVIFPIVARIKEGYVLVDGNKYSMKNHGLIRYNKLDVISSNDSELVLGFKYNDDTLLQYPFKFNFEVCYKLNVNELTIEYRVYNLDDKEMYFNVGGHPAFIVNGYENEKGYVFDNVKLVFDKDYKVNQFVLNESGNFIASLKEIILGKEINITKELIEEEKTLIYDVKDIDEVVLDSNGKKFVFDISKALVLAVWTNPGFGNYLCVEPWWGLPDFDNHNNVLKEKNMITTLEANGKYVTDYKIKFEV